VAAASILARADFLTSIDNLSAKYKLRFPKGAHSKVIQTGKEFVNRYGSDRLNEVAKLHFKTTHKIYSRNLFNAVYVFL